MLLSMQSCARARFARVGAVFASVATLTLVGCGTAMGDRPAHEPSRSEAAQDEIEVLRAAARPIESPDDLGQVIAWVGDAPFVLIGEASHGTEEFYRLRAELTKRLIFESGLDAVLIEGDWSSVARVDRYVRGLSGDLSAHHSLAEFRRFPLWMWRNEAVVDFIEWLRQYNEGLPAEQRVGFYGLDLYSPQQSAAALFRSLPPDAAARARARLDCFVGPGVSPGGHVRENEREGKMEACSRDLAAEVTELERSGATLDQVENARVVRDAARYRTVEGEPSWNVRDRHMAEAVDAIRAHYAASRGTPRLAIWAHNSHLGDARATDASLRGQVNLGQLLKEHYGDKQVFNIGFSTYTGEVTAASEWYEPAHKKQVNPGRDDSYEGVLHDVGGGTYALDLRDPAVARALEEPRLARAIGVVYRPDTERQSHYFSSELPAQFDAVIHVDTTTALEPLDGWQE